MKAELPKRKSTRLKGYDYSSPGAYFVTICTRERKCILSEIFVGEGLCALPKSILSPVGTIVEKSIQYINDNYEGVIIEKYVIMPNHVHLIVTLNAEGDGTPSLQKVVGQLKSYTTKKYGDIFWQRSYHDHIIRNEEDYRKIWGYVDTNAARWEKDCFYEKLK